MPQLTWVSAVLAGGWLQRGRWAPWLVLQVLLRQQRGHHQPVNVQTAAYLWRLILAQTTALLVYRSWQAVILRPVSFTWVARRSAAWLR